MGDAVHHAMLEGHVEILLEWLAESCKSGSGAEIAELCAFEELSDSRLCKYTGVNRDPVELGDRVQGEHAVAAAA